MIQVIASNIDTRQLFVLQYLRKLHKTRLYQLLVNSEYNLANFINILNSMFPEANLDQNDKRFIDYIQQVLADKHLAFRDDTTFSDRPIHQVITKKQKEILNYLQQLPEQNMQDLLKNSRYHPYIFIQNINEMFQTNINPQNRHFMSYVREILRSKKLSFDSRRPRTTSELIEEAINSIEFNNIQKAINLRSDIMTLVRWMQQQNKNLAEFNVLSVTPSLASAIIEKLEQHGFDVQKYKENKKVHPVTQFLKDSYYESPDLFINMLNNMDEIHRGQWQTRRSEREGRTGLLNLVNARLFGPSIPGQPLPVGHYSYSHAYQFVNQALKELAAEGAPIPEHLLSTDEYGRNTQSINPITRKLQELDDADLQQLVNSSHSLSDFITQKLRLNRGEYANKLTIRLLLARNIDFRHWLKVGRGKHEVTDYTLIDQYKPFSKEIREKFNWYHPIKKFLETVDENTLKLLLFYYSDNDFLNILNQTLGTNYGPEAVGIIKNTLQQRGEDWNHDLIDTVKTAEIYTKENLIRTASTIDRNFPYLADAIDMILEGILSVID